MPWGMLCGMLGAAPRGMRPPRPERWCQPRSAARLVSIARKLINNTNKTCPEAVQQAGSNPSSVPPGRQDLYLKRSRNNALNGPLISLFFSLKCPPSGWEGDPPGGGAGGREPRPGGDPARGCGGGGLLCPLQGGIGGNGGDWRPFPWAPGNDGNWWPKLALLHEFLRKPCCVGPCTARRLVRCPGGVGRP